MADGSSNVQMPSTASASAPTPIPVGESHTSASLLCEPTDIASPPPEEQELRQIKYTSGVWADFKREAKLDGSVTTTCNHCNGKLDGRSIRGITHLRNHSSRCHCKPKQDINQQILTMGKSSFDSNEKLMTFKFDAEVEKELFAQMIMKHDLPFLFASMNISRIGFRTYVLLITLEQEIHLELTV